MQNIISNYDIVIAGNDAIVAFSRRYEVVVVIHQLNEALWKIGEDDADTESKKSNNLDQGNYKVLSQIIYSTNIYFYIHTPKDASA